MQTTSTIYIDQILHGYDRGHRELTASTSLDDQSRARMLVLSDSLIASGFEDEFSYLTCYPLPYASKHVLARTWSAGRGYRPGSVWTHSLIIDYQALTLIHDLNMLGCLFKHPEKENGYEYKNPILISNFTSDCVPVAQDSRTIQALIQLYGTNCEKEIKIPHLNKDSDEILALQLWRQMWPGLRRDFAFITCTSNDFNGIDAGCILRFIDFKNYQPEPTVGLNEKGYSLLLEDLHKSGPTGLRSFVGRYVIESKSPRKLVIPLIKLQHYKNSGLLNLNLEQAISLSQDEKLPRLALDTLLESLNNNAINNSFIIKIMQSVNQETTNIELKKIMDRVELFSDLEIKTLLKDVDLNNEKSIGYKIFFHISRTATLETLLSIVTDNNRFLMLKNRPDLANFREFWPESDSDISEIAQKMYEIHELKIFNLDKAIDVFGYDIGKDTISVFLNQMTELSKSIIDLICYCNDEASEKITDWILKNPNLLIEFVDVYTKMTPNITIANKLTRSQIKSKTHIEKPRLWSDLILTSLKDNNQKIDSSCLVIGYLSALMMEEENSLTLAKLVYDQLQYSVRNYGLSISEEMYLKNKLHDYSPHLLLSTRISRSAITKWPPLENNNLGALDISRNITYLKEILQELKTTYGYINLEEALKSDNLTIESKNRIKWVLNITKSKKNKKIKKNILRWWI